MIVREVVRFRSTLPEDIIETEDGRDFVQPPGKSVGDAIAAIFLDLDFENYYALAPRGDFMWEIGIRKSRHSFGAVLNLVEDYFLSFERLSWADKILRRYPIEYLDLLRGVSDAFAADPRFFDVRWFTYREGGYGTPGELNPIAERGSPQAAKRNR